MYRRVAIPILALLAVEVDLVLTAGALGIGLRRAHPAITVLAAAGVSAAVGTALFAVWFLWFVAPACVLATGACAGQAELDQALTYAAGWATANGVLMSAIGLAARGVKAAGAGTRGIRIAE